MNIEFNNTTKTKINTEILVKASNYFSKQFKIKNKLVSVAFVGNKKIRELNNKYRKIDKVTDILSFGGDEREFLGELIICYQQIKKQAQELKISIKEELVFIFIHGMLHLVGYDDCDDKGHEEMMKVGKKLTKLVLKK